MIECNCFKTILKQQAPILLLSSNNKITEFQIWLHCDIFKKYPKINVLLTCSNCFIVNMTSEKSKIKRLSNLLSNICETKMKSIYKCIQQFLPHPQHNYSKGRQAHHMPISIHSIQRLNLLWRNVDAERGSLVTTTDPKGCLALSQLHTITTGKAEGSIETQFSIFSPISTCFQNPIGSYWFCLEFFWGLPYLQDKA